MRGLRQAQAVWIDSAAYLITLGWRILAGDGRADTVWVRCATDLVGGALQEAPNPAGKIESSCFSGHGGSGLLGLWNWRGRYCPWRGEQQGQQEEQGLATK